MAKTIQIDGTYFIQVEELNWTLKKHVPYSAIRKNGVPSKNAGQMKTVTLGYYPNLEMALGAYAHNIENDAVAEAQEPVNIEELKTILLRLERACKALKLAETED